MLLAINIGNSSIRFGVFKKDKCVAKWLIKSKVQRYPDEYKILLYSLMQENKIRSSNIKSVVAASVVPELSGPIRDVVKQLFKKEVMFINIKMNTGIIFPVENMTELGADLLANAVAAVNIYKKDSIIVDFGTAMSFTVVRKNGHLSGVVIAPGVVSALNSLVADTAQLPSIEICKPEKVIGTNTIASIQSGITHGYAGLIENIIKKIDKEQGYKSYVIATGGSSPAFKKIIKRIDTFDELHTLKGLNIIHKLNKTP